MSFFENTRKPDGIGGKIMVSVMNMGHKALDVLEQIGFSKVDVQKNGKGWIAVTAQK